jgi:hypothetical protein
MEQPTDLPEENADSSAPSFSYEQFIDEELELRRQRRRQKWPSFFWRSLETALMLAIIFFSAYLCFRAILAEVKGVDYYARERHFD